MSVLPQRKKSLSKERVNKTARSEEPIERSKIKYITIQYTMNYITIQATMNYVSNKNPIVQ